MKKVLILAYDFPPYVSVGGLRPYSWYKYFHEFGVYPIVVTRQWSNKHQNHLDYIEAGTSDFVIEEADDKGTILRTPYKPNLSNRLLLKYGESRYTLLRKVISAYYEVSQFMLFNGPKAGLYYGAKEYLKKNKVDCIIATAEPYVLLKYASALGKKFNTPWIADYRDPWSQNENVYKNIFLKRYYSFVEKKILSKANLITTVSRFFETKIATLAGNKKFYIIPNGYDPEPVEKTKHIKQNSDVFSIALVGTILQWHPIDSFLEAVNEFITSNPDAKVQVNFYGINIENEVKNKVTTLPAITNHVTIYPKMNNQLLLANIAENNIMLLFNYYSYMGTKIYDYLGIKRLILLCYTNDNEANDLKQRYYNLQDDDKNAPQLQSELIHETKAGIVIRDKAHLLTEIGNLYGEFKAKGFVACNSVNTEQFSRKIQTQKLAEVVATLKPV
jgi:glycosyltransferase involved in cell wall biosynthesis